MTDPIIELLQKIADNTAHSNSIWVAAVAGGSALLGAALSGTLSYLAAKQQFSAQSEIERAKMVASVVSNERLRWLQELRSRTADFYTKMDMQLSHLERPVTESFQDFLDKSAEEAISLSHSIYLLLNREKENQLKLYNAIGSTLQFISNTIDEKTQATMHIDKTPYKEAKVAAFAALESIGQESWEKIKSLE